MLNTEGIEKTCPMCNIEATIESYTFVGESGVAILKRAPPPKEDKEKDKEKEK